MRRIQSKSSSAGGRDELGSSAAQIDAEPREEVVARRRAFARLGLRAATLAGVVAVAAGCAKPAQVQSALPVKKVVVYRNGMAYFERTGKVDDESVQFRLRQENVGDFLATLAIMERGGHSVRSASFPVSLEQENSEGDPELVRALDSWERERPDPRKLRTVTLSLDKGAHDLSVGYLVETPLWRPSYRLVLGTDGRASLQVWGIVSNQSGENWENVELSLVSGAPIAFESTLGDPVIPRRPVVTDEGEVVTSVPQGSASYHSEDEAEPQEESAAYSFGADGEAAESRPMAKRYRSQDSLEVSENDAPAGAPAPPRPQMNAVDFGPRGGSALAQLEVQSGSTRYQVPGLVTIPDESATMVLLVSEEVPGQGVLLFSPDPGVQDSARYPFRVARFENRSGGPLEKGPIAVFEQGAFLGQGMLKSLPVQAQATVPFALVRDVVIDRTVKFDERDVRFDSVQHGSLYINRHRTTLSTYKVQNGSAEPVELIIRHPRAEGAELHEPPPGTDDNLAEQAAFVPTQVAKFGKAVVTVDERLPLRTVVAWDSAEARTALKGAIEADWASPEQKKALAEILEQSQMLSDLAANEQKLSTEQRELEKSARETRLSLSAIEKNGRAVALRAELTARLRDTTQRLDELTRELVELGLRRSEAEIKLKQLKETLEIPSREHAAAGKKELTKEGGLPEGP